MLPHKQFEKKMKHIINTCNGSTRHDLLRHANNGMKLYSKLMSNSDKNASLLRREIQVAYDLVGSGLV